MFTANVPHGTRVPKLPVKYVPTQKAHHRTDKSAHADNQIFHHFARRSSASPETQHDDTSPKIEVNRGKFRESK